MKQRNCFNGFLLAHYHREPSVFFTLIEKDFVMYQKFCIVFFVAALVCGLLVCFGATAEASMLGSIPEIQNTVAPVLVKPIANFVMLLITVAALFL